jgi:CDGSH-type Zn-finger protein
MNNGERAGESAIAVEVEKDKSYYWCSCGKSAKQPFCDGSHKGTEFTPLAYKAEETKKCFFVLANKLTIRHFVTDHITKNKG